jgi:hypothetical protein
MEVPVMSSMPAVDQNNKPILVVTDYSKYIDNDRDYVVGQTMDGNENTIRQMFPQDAERILNEVGKNWNKDIRDIALDVKEQESQGKTPEDRTN